MDDYLATVKKNLENLSSSGCCHVVIGNESCDLDSAVCALTYSFYLNQVNKDQGQTLVVPVLNIPRRLYRVRTEIVHLLDKCHVQPEHLVFLDDLDLEKLGGGGQLKVTLVDHNVLTGGLQALEDKVVSVIDHHVSERQDKDCVTVKLDVVGSCCTLVAEELLADPDFVVDETVAELLYGTILIDTVNRLPEAGKITPRDDAVLERLHTIIPKVDGDKLFADIQTAKLDMSGLTNMDILEKDLKMVSGTTMVIAMSSVTMDMQELLGRPDFKADLETFCSSKMADVAVVMTMSTDSDSQPARQIAVFSTNRIYRDQIADVLDNTGDLDLDLEPVFAPYEDISVFLQGNVEASRKTVMPVLGSFLHGDCSPDVASKDFVADQDVSVTTEGFSSFSNIIEPEDLDLQDTLTDSGHVQTTAKVGNSSHEHTPNAELTSKGSNSTNTHGQNFTSAQRSSANSSTLFDFLTDGSSDLMDPFSSVEDNTAAENSPVKKESNQSGTGNAYAVESSSGADLNTANDTETDAMEKHMFNPFMSPASQDEDVFSKNPFSSVTDDFDPLGSGSGDNSYVMFDPLGPATDTSDDNPFGPDVTMNVTSNNPFQQNDTTGVLADLPVDQALIPNIPDKIMNNPFQQNDGASVLAEKTGEQPLIPSIPDGNPFVDNLADFGDAFANNFADVKDPFVDNLADVNDPFVNNLADAKLSTNGTLTSGFDDGFVDNLADFNDPFVDNVVDVNDPFVDNVVDVNDPFVDNVVDVNDPFGTLTADPQQSSSTNPFLPNDSALAPTTVTHISSAGDPFGSNDDVPVPIAPIIDPFGLLEHQNSVSSEQSEEDVQARLDYLGIGTEGGPRAKARKSISLIVEFDGDSGEEDNLAELDEADFYDKVPTPEAEKSGNTSPFINPNFTVPFEYLRSGRSSESGSAFPSVATPPNSVREGGMDMSEAKDHDLPSFNNAEMVERIRTKKRHMVAPDDSMGSCEMGLISTPYTPQNSFRDDQVSFRDNQPRLSQGLDLLAFDDENMTEKVKEKRNSLGVFSPVDLDNVKTIEDLGAVPKDKNNAFHSDFDDFPSQKTQGKAYMGDLEELSARGDLVSAYSVPNAPSNSFIESNGEYMDKTTVSGMELFDKLAHIQDTDASVSEDDLGGVLDFSITPDSRQCSQNQTGTQFPYGENLNQSNIYDKVDLSREFEQDMIPERKTLTDTTKADLSREFEQDMIAERKTLTDMAEAAAVETLSSKLTADILHEAVDTFPDMENQSLAECVTVEVLMGDNSNWTDQGSGDSGIASNDSPQQALPKSPRSPRSPMRRRGNDYQYSVETEYLPNMDPYHGNLNIVTSPSASSQTIETDADKEVVESESFRKASGQGEEIAAQELVSMETAPVDAIETGTKIRSMIISDNLVSSRTSVDKDSEECLAGAEASTNLVDLYDVNIQKESESMNEESPEASDPEDMLELGQPDMGQVPDVVEQLPQGTVAPTEISLIPEIAKQPDDMLEQTEIALVPEIIKQPLEDSSIAPTDVALVSETVEHHLEEGSIAPSDIALMPEIVKQPDDMQEQTEISLVPEIIEHHLEDSSIAPSDVALVPEIVEQPDDMLDLSDTAMVPEIVEQPDDMLEQSDTAMVPEIVEQHLEGSNAPPAVRIDYCDQNWSSEETSEPSIDRTGADTDGVTEIKDASLMMAEHPDMLEAVSISPDSSSSYASTTDSESELITVRENIAGDSRHRSPEVEDKQTELGTGLDNAKEAGVTDGTRFKSDVDASHPDNEDVFVFDEQVKDTRPKQAVYEITKEEQDKHTEKVEISPSNEILQNESVHESTDIADKLDDLVDKSEKVQEEQDSVRLIDASMTESSLTTETVSPAETPKDEHVAGFYEINPEARETGELGESFYSTNLGENETGFYEINPESLSSSDANSATSQTQPEKIQTQGNKDGGDNTPAINIADFDDDKGACSDDDSENTRLNDMNAKLQGTVLQNIDIGHAFSPIESPNDDSFNVNYQINPMVSDNENTDTEESDNADDLFTNYTEGPQFVNTNLQQDEKVIDMAETMVTEAITGAMDVVQELQFKKNEKFIVTEIASAMGTGTESSDSDNSSTTTEGSYRIPHSQDDSPVMSPEMDSFMKENLSQDIKRLVKDDNVILEENTMEESGVPEEVDTFELKQEHIEINESVEDADDIVIPEESAEEESGKLEEIYVKQETIEGVDDTSKRIHEEEEDIKNGNIYGANVMKFSEKEEKIINKIEETLDEADETTSNKHHEDKALSKTYDSDTSDPINTMKNTSEVSSVTGIDLKRDNNSTEMYEQNNKEEDVISVRLESPDNKDSSDVNAIPDIRVENTEGKIVCSETDNKVVASEKVSSMEQESPDTKGSSDVNAIPDIRVENTEGEIVCSETDDKVVAAEKVSSMEQELADTKDSSVISSVPEIRVENAEEHTICSDTDDKVAPLDKETGDAENVSDATETSTEDSGTKYVTRKEIFYTTSGRMSISIDSVVDPPDTGDQSQAVQGPDTIQEEKEPVDEDDDIDLIEEGKSIPPSQPPQPPQPPRPQAPPTTPAKAATQDSHGRLREMEDTQEWHEDPIPGMVAQDDPETDSESDSDTDSEYVKPVRPDSLLHGGKRKKRIAANSNMVGRDSTDELVEGVDDLPTPDDLSTPDDMEGEELEWEDDTPITPLETKKFAEYRDDDEEVEREQRENTQFRKVEIAGKDYRVDMHVIEPYKKVLSHGGYYGDGLNAIILFCGCYLPDRGRRDYQYVMDNLFLYVISTLELLVAEDYMIVYFHGATPRRQMPSFGWLKRCYQMIDRRLRKNLKALLMVHPTLWLKTVVMMTKPFISSKFSSKLRFVKTLHELGKIVPMEYIYVPDPVTQYDTRLKQHRSSSSSSSAPISPTSPS